MQSTTTPPTYRVILQYLALAAAVIFAMLIVGGLLIVLNHSHFSPALSNQAGGLRLYPLAIHPSVSHILTQTSCRPVSSGHVVVCVHHQGPLIRQQGSR